MANSHFEDRPRSLASPEACTARQAELHDSHIASLTAFVDDLRLKMGLDYNIPYFDPWDGGIVAEALFLFEAPGPRAKSSGFISRNNPDPSANNFFLFNQQSGIPRKRTISWNIVPWYIGSASRIRPATSDDIKAGVRSLDQLLDHLPKLKTVVLFGKKAQRGRDYIAAIRPDIRLFESPHPSQQSINGTPGNREKILAVLREVATYVGS